MTGKEMNDEFDLLYDTASAEAPGLDNFEKSMFLTKGMYELTEKNFNEYLHNASRGFHDDEVNRDALKGFISSAVVELEKTPVKSSDEAAAEAMMSDGRVVDPNAYTMQKIEPTTENSYFFQRPSDSMGVIHEDVILKPKVDTVKVNRKLVANVTPIRYDHIDRLMKNPFMRPRHDLAFRLNHSDYDGTSLSEIICDAKYVAYQYRLKYVKRPYPIILENLDSGWDGELISIESQVLPYLEPKYEDNIRAIAENIRVDLYSNTYTELYKKYLAQCMNECQETSNSEIAICEAEHFDATKEFVTTFNNCSKLCNDTKLACLSTAADAINTCGLGCMGGDACEAGCLEVYNGHVTTCDTNYNNCMEPCANTYGTAMAPYNATLNLCKSTSVDNIDECEGLCEQTTIDKAKTETDASFPSIANLSLEETKLYIINTAPEGSDYLEKMAQLLRLSQATNIDITMHHDIVQRGVELAILHYRENTLQNNMQAKIKQD